MEAMPFSSLALSFMGIQVSPVIPKWTICWNYFIRTGSILTMLSIISIPIYCLFFLDPVIISGTAVISVYSLKLATYVLTVRDSGSLAAVLTKTVTIRFTRS